MERPRKKRVLVLDSSELTRLGILSLLNSSSEFSVLLDTGDAILARKCCAEHQPDFVILDLELQHGDGIELLRDLSHLAPQSRGIVITGHEDAQSLQRAFRAGARAFVSKFDPPSDLMLAMDQVMRGEPFASRRIVYLVLRFLADGQLRGAGHNLELLSDRELQVFRLLGKGFGPKDVAGELGISVRTIETHQMRIKEKLGVTTCAELQTMASRLRPRATR